MTFPNFLSKAALAAALALGLAPVAANASCSDGVVYVNNTETYGGRFDGTFYTSNFCNNGETVVSIGWYDVIWGSGDYTLLMMGPSSETVSVTAYDGTDFHTFNVTFYGNS